MWKPSLGEGITKHRNYKIGLEKCPRAQAPPSYRHPRIWPDFWGALLWWQYKASCTVFYSFLVGKFPHQRSVLVLPPAPLPPARSIFSEWEKPYILTLPQTALPEESAFWTMNSWYWRSSARKSLQLYLWHSELLFIPLSVHVIFKLRETEDKCCLMPTQCNRENGKG